MLQILGLSDPAREGIFCVQSFNAESDKITICARELIARAGVEIEGVPPAANARNIGA